MWILEGRKRSLGNVIVASSERLLISYTAYDKQTLIFLNELL